MPASVRRCDLRFPVVPDGRYGKACGRWTHQVKSGSLRASPRDVGNGVVIQPRAAELRRYGIGLLTPECLLLAETSRWQMSACDPKQTFARSLSLHPVDRGYIVN